MPKMKLLSQAEATALDEDLMVTPGFSIDQLMELAGLSVAAAVQKQYPLRSHARVLCVCGPGNNGGDGLVAARHLMQFGYSPTVVYPKRPGRPLFVNLAAQMSMMGIEMLDAVPADADQRYDVILDAVFGFSFSGEVRAPFDEVLASLRTSALPICSVDIPSGWDVERGPIGGDDALRPETLISLTAPKLGSAAFEGFHYLGGRFVPEPIFAKYGFRQPPFPAAEQVVLLSGPSCDEMVSTDDDFVRLAVCIFSATPSRRRHLARSFRYFRSLLCLSCRSAGLGASRAVQALLDYFRS